MASKNIHHGVLLGALLGLAGCTMGVDGDYVGLGGSVVQADAALLEQGPVSGSTLEIATAGERDALDVRFTVDAEGELYDARLRVDGDILDVLHGAGGSAVLELEAADGTILEIPVTLRATSTGSDWDFERYRVDFAGDGGNGPTRGYVVFEVAQGHC